MANMYYLLSLVFVLAISMSIHELAHGLVAHILGDNTAKDQGRLSLNPLDHIDPYMTIIIPSILLLSGAPVLAAAKPVPINKDRLKWKEFGVAIVAVAGPLANLLLAIVCFYLIKFINLGDSLISFLMTSMVRVNIGLMIFNLLPIPPLDGSRVAYAFAPDFVRNIFDKIEGKGSLFIFVLIFVFSRQIGLIVSIFYDAIIKILVGFF